MSPHRVCQLPSPLALQSYAISRNGFLPEEPPLVTLTHSYYRPWECIIDRLDSHLKGWRIRNEIDVLPVLTTTFLTAETDWRRAYLILALLSQAYIWQGPRPSDRLPPAVSVPFLQVADHLGIVPAATYAALNLWNWRPVSPGLDISNPENQQVLHSFTGTVDENWFFVISTAMEAKAAPLLEKMLSAIQSVDLDDSEFVVASLLDVTEVLRQIGALIQRMGDRCDPYTFYHDIRPNLAGSLNMSDAGLPRGVYFDQGAEEGQWIQLRGGSNAQSSMIQFFDVVLGVRHDQTAGFHQEMRKYMPGPHAKFLDDLEEISNIRPYVLRNKQNGKLTDAYNAAVTELSSVRDKHIQMATKYIVIQSRAKSPVAHDTSLNLAAATSKKGHEGSGKDLVGTGGTKLIPFLRQSRDETYSGIMTTD